MENKKKQEVIFLQEKTFGEIIGSPFYFIFQEFKMFVGVLIKYAAPFVAISFLAVSLLAENIYSASINNSEPSGLLFLYISVLALSVSLGLLSVTVVTHSYITLYVKKGKGNFSKEDIGESLKKNIWKVLITGLISYLLIFAGILLFYIPGIYFSVALSFVFIISVYEKQPVGKTISRSFEVVKGRWWQTFGLVIVFGFIVGAMSYVFIIPIYIVFTFAVFGGSQIGTGSVIFITLFVFLYFTAYLFFMSMQQIMIAFQYFNILAGKEGLHLKSRIAAITENDKPEEQSEIITDKKEIEERTEQENDKKEKNRFTDDDDINRFKPKY